MVPFGSVWSCMFQYGYILSHMVVYGPLWTPMVLYGLWHFKLLYCSIQSCKVSNSCRYLKLCVLVVYQIIPIFFLHNKIFDQKFFSSKVFLGTFFCTHTFWEINFGSIFFWLKILLSYIFGTWIYKNVFDPIFFCTRTKTTTTMTLMSFDTIEINLVSIIYWCRILLIESYLKILLDTLGLVLTLRLRRKSLSLVLISRLRKKISVSFLILRLRRIKVSFLIETHRNKVSVSVFNPKVWSRYFLGKNKKVHNCWDDGVGES